MVVGRNGHLVLTLTTENNDETPSSQWLTSVQEMRENRWISLDINWCYCTSSSLTESYSAGHVLDITSSDWEVTKQSKSIVLSSSKSSWRRDVSQWTGVIYCISGDAYQWDRRELGYHNSWYEIRDTCGLPVMGLEIIPSVTELNGPLI